MILNGKPDRTSSGPVKTLNFGNNVSNESAFGQHLRQLSRTNVQEIRQLILRVPAHLYLALTCLTLLVVASPAHAFDNLIVSDTLIGPDGGPCLEAFVGPTENTRIQHDAINSQTVGGAIWDGGVAITSTSSLTEAALDVCGYTSTVIVSQVGPTGPSYSADDYIGIVWRASELGSTEVYEYEFAISGAVVTSFVNTSELIGFRPTVSIGSDTPTLAIGDTAEITFMFDRAVTIENASAVTATGGSLGTISGSGTVYSATFTPSANSTTSAEIKIGNGAFKDVSGFTNQDGADSNNSVSMTVDTVAPTISIAAFTGAANGNQTAVITLSEASTDFVLADLTLTNATATLSGSGTSYTAVLTADADGEVKLSVAAASFTDAAGNANTASNVVSTTTDITEPTVSISTTATAISGATTLNVIVTFSEDVTGFEASDVLVVNGSVTTITGSGADYVAQITATGNGDTTVSVPAGAATDLAGNASQASNTVTIQNSVVEKTQRIIAQVIQSRASQLISSQPNLSGILSGSGSGGFNMDVTQAGGNFHFVSAPGTESGLWARVNGTWTNEETRETKYAFGALGHHFAASPNILIGGMVEFDFISQQDSAETVEGQGWLAGVYVVTRVPNHPLFIDGRLLYGQTTNDVSPAGTYTDTFETERWLAQVNVSGELQFHATTLIPSVQLVYTTDDQAAYTDGLGNTIPSQGVEIWQAATGLDVRHDVALQNSKASLELTGGIAAIGASTRGTGNSSGVTPSYEGIRARLNMGANYTMENGARHTLETFYDGIGVSSYESYGVQVGFNLAF